MSRTIESPLSLNEARDRILALAEPVEAIEVSLGEAIGLVLAEPVVADVDHPPFDRAIVDGYAVRSTDATLGAVLRVVEPGRAGRSSDWSIEAGEAGRVVAGDPLPPGSDSVARSSSVRADPDGPTRVVEVLRATGPSQNVTLRGTYLTAGTTLATSGTRIKSAMVPLLASQGCVHPVCHRRVRVAVLSLGNQWVHPAEAPTMNRERNATNAAIVALSLQSEAMPHDYQFVSGSKIQPTLERASSAPVLIILGSSSRPLARALRTINVEPVVNRVAIESFDRFRYGSIQDDDGKVVNHVFHFPSNPVAASIGYKLLVQPLINRLQGEIPDPVREKVTLAQGQSQPSTGSRCRIVPAKGRLTPNGQWEVQSIAGASDDLLAWSRADGFLIFSERSGPWQGGDLVDYISITPRF